MFEGRAHTKKTRSFGQKLSKSVQKDFFVLLFQKIAGLTKNWQNRVLIVIWECSKNQFGRPKNVF